MYDDAMDLARHIIEYGTTEADLLPRQAPLPEAEAAVLERLAVHEHWPRDLRPQPAPLTEEPGLYDPLPTADYLIVTWTVAEVEALADVLTPGFGRHTWYRYARGFQRHYLPNIREGAPARNARRLGSYFLTRVGAARVLCFKSELHLNQDGIMQPSGWATLPVGDLLRQMIREVRPKLVLTVGTAGATHPAHQLGDVLITRAAQFRCRQEFGAAPFNNRAYRDEAPLPDVMLGPAGDLLRLQDEHLIEPDFGPPTGRYSWEGPLLPGTRNRPVLRVDGRGGEDDFGAFHPILSTDSFEFGTTENDLWAHGCGLEMGDAVLGLVAAELGGEAPRWVVVRNASDPVINARLPRGERPLDMQAHWAVWYYESFGYWTSVNSAIAAWALVAGDSRGDT